MNLSAPIAALEIGTSRTVIAIGEPLSNGHVKIAALREIPSVGVSKSQIHDFGQARYSVENVLKQLAEKDGYAIGQASLVLSGAHIQTHPVNAQLQIEHGTVDDEDINQIVDMSYDPNLPSDRTPLELSQIDFGLDERDHLASPRGLHGHLLKLHSLCIHGLTERISDAKNVASAAKLEIDDNDIFFAGTCASAAVLTPQMKREGVLVIDLGGGTTSFAVWVEGRLVQAGVLAVGGNHVRQDIRHAFALTRAQAEQIKIESASCLVSSDDGDHRIAVPTTLPGFKTASVSRRSLNTVVNARMQELFTIIRSKLDEENRLHNLHCGVVLTGGGALLKNVDDLATAVFGCNAVRGTIIPEIEGLDAFPVPPVQAAVIAGLLIQARADVMPHSMFDSVKHLFGGLFRK